MQNSAEMTMKELIKATAGSNKDFRLERKGEVRLSVDVQDRFVSLY